MIEQDGGKLLTKSFLMLRKMDSFLRESQRMNPIDLRKFLQINRCFELSAADLELTL